MFGWLALGGSVANLAWLANPALFLAWIATRAGLTMIALPCSVAALMLAASFPTMKTVVTNEGGVPLPITGMRVGYWLRLASMSVSVTASIMQHPGTRRSRQDSAPSEKPTH